MKSFDTNIIVRLVVKDDPAQCALAERALRDAISSGGAFITATALVETAWVLRAG